MAQTAANVAGGIVGAFVESFKSFDDAVSAFDVLRADLFKELAAVVDADNEKFAAEDGGGRVSNATSKSTATKRGSKTSGGSKSRSSKGGSTISLDDALGMVLNFGAFEGENLGDVLGFDTDTCDDDFSYGDGERNGQDYVSWLASDKNQNEYVQRRARIVADEEGIDY